MLIKLFLGDVGSYLVRKFEKTPLDIHSIQILECESQNSPGNVIDTIKFMPGTSYVETHNAASNNDELWYRVRFVSDPETDPMRIFGETEYLLPENIAGLIDEVRSWLGDYDPTGEDASWEPVYSDQHYLQIIRYALMRHKGIKNISLLRPEDWIPVKILVMIEYANDIAFDYSKYYNLTAPGNASLNLSEVKTHYLETAEALRNNYREITKSYNMDGGGYDEDGNISQMPAIQEGTLYRYSRAKGRYERDPAYELRTQRSFRRR